MSARLPKVVVGTPLFLGLAAVITLLLFSSYRNWAVKESTPLKYGEKHVPMNLTSAELEMLREVSDRLSDVPEEEMPPMIRGMFKTQLPMYYTCDESASPITRQLMEIGFAPTGKLTFVPSYPTDPPEELLREFLGLASNEGDDIAGLLRKLGTDPTEMSQFQSYMKMMAEAYRSGAEEVVLMRDSISPAVSIYWDADFDEYLRIVDTVAQGRQNWGTVNLAYYYPERHDWRTAYIAWKRGMPLTRLKPATPAARGNGAAFWTRAAMETMLSTYRRYGLESLDDRTKDVFDCSRRPGNVRNCRIDLLTMATLQKLALLIQPPLFAYRPIPEETFVTGWKRLNDPGMRELQQAVADTFKWQAENAEVFEGLHGFLRLTDAEQQIVFDDAVARAQARIKAAHRRMGDDEIKAKIDAMEPVHLLAQRLLEFLPDTEWIAKEY